MNFSFYPQDQQDITRNKSFMIKNLDEFVRGVDGSRDWMIKVEIVKRSEDVRNQSKYPDSKDIRNQK